MRRTTSRQKIQNYISPLVSAEPACADAARLFKIGNRKFVPAQMLLNRDWLDVEVRSSHHGAVIVGDFFEEASGHLLNLTRLSVNGCADLCPDLGTYGKLVVECKACNLVSGRTFIFFEYQIEQYDELEADNTPVLFALWSYRFSDKHTRVKDFIWREDLRRVLCSSIERMYILSLTDIHDALRGIRVEDGSTWRGCEGMGFQRLRWNRLLEYAQGWHSTEVRGLKAYERQCCNFTVYTNQTTPEATQPKEVPF